MNYPRRPNDLRANDCDSDSDTDAGRQTSDMYGRPIPPSRPPPQGPYRQPLDNPAPGVYIYPYHQISLNRNPPVAPLQLQHRYGFPANETPRNALTHGRHPAGFDNEDTFGPRRRDSRGLQPQYRADDRGFSSVTSSDDDFSRYGTDDDSIGAGPGSRDNPYDRGVAAQRDRGAGAHGGGFGGAGRGGGGHGLFQYQGGRGGGRELGSRRNPSRDGPWLDDSEEEA